MEDTGQLTPSMWIETHGDHLYRFALSRLRDADAAEEVVQETLVTAWRKRDQFAGRGSERAWLLGILKRKIVDAIRQRNRTSSVVGEDGEDLLDQMFDPRGNWRDDWKRVSSLPSGQLERREFWQIFQNCLRQLPTRQADVFILREMDDETTEEICKDLGITPSNVWVLLYRARVRLAECMKRRWRQEQG